MEITNITIRKINSEGKMKAIVSVTFDNDFVVHDIKVIEGNKGVFVAMPSRKNKNGIFKDVAHPINAETRKMIEEAVLAKFDEETETTDEEFDDVDLG